MYIIAIKHTADGNQQCILFLISIVEITLTGLSILISLWATYISDYINHSCVKIIEDINRSNEPISKEQDFVLLSNKAKNVSKHTAWMKFVILVIFVFYFISLIVYNFILGHPLVGMLSMILGSISTVITIILAVVSSVSSVVSGRYLHILLTMLYKANQKIFDQYNELKITKSYNNNGDRA